MLFRPIDISHLVKKADYSAKIIEIEKKIPDHKKYITTNYFNKFSGLIFAERLKQAKLATIIYLCTCEQCAIKNEEKIEKLQTFNLSYFLGKKFLVMMIFKICLFINQHLVYWI